MQETNNVRNWASDIDEGTRLQAEKAARSPAVSGPLALMPDAHVGIGATIGSVIPTKDAIIPSAVGVDLGCGMIAAETTLVAGDLPNLQGLVEKLYNAVPAGVGKGQTKFSNLKVVRRAEAWLTNNQPPQPLGMDLAVRALNQLGTLGSGNHFVEVCLDENDVVWVVLHSGSRGVGNKLAQSHIKLARELHKKLQTPLEDPDLAFFMQGSDEFDAYIADMLWAQDYALENRELMMMAVLAELASFTTRNFGVISKINCHHNYATQEVHEEISEKPIWITRKGAIRAEVGDLGVIPGSMATGSYIVEGRGRAISYNSCSHGAGRRMSRKQAKLQFTAEGLTERMGDRAWNKNAQALLDEHPESYKDLEVVMDDQKDLIIIKHKLSTVMNYKGV